MREYRGTLTEAGKDSPYRTRTAAESRALREQMKAGEIAEGEMTLREIDTASPNINMRDLTSTELSVFLIANRR